MDERHSLHILFDYTLIACILFDRAHVHSLSYPINDEYETKLDSIFPPLA